MDRGSVTQTVVRELETDLLVVEASIVAEDVVALTLARPDGEPLPAWTPGAHIDLLLGNDLVRQYSLCSMPGDPSRWRVGVLRAPDSRGGSVYVHDRLTTGATVRARGPRNHFALVAAPSYVFIAGGIGITPLLPMIAEVDARGADWTLHYGGRTAASMAFVEELAGYGERVHLIPEDTDGRPDLTAIVGSLPAGGLVYTCGPEGLLGAVEAACAALPPGSCHLERFSAKPQEVPAGGDTSFELVLNRSGLTLSVPADKSVFDVVREAGVSVLGSCLEGICGTCETEVVDGEVDHRDSVLSPDEQESNETMMICVSRCRSARLTLDL
jgi:ferredoxin-NADP reductase